MKVACDDGPNCGCCGYVNYAELGYLGAVARWAKVWDVTKAEAERRMMQRQVERDVKAGYITQAELDEAQAWDEAMG